MVEIPLFTIGYEKRNLDDFVFHLNEANIDCLIDVRDMPISRKKGFSKKALQSRLELEKINYVHFRDLGCPSHMRKKLKLDKDYQSFFREFAKLLSGKRAVLEKVSLYVQSNTCCLMCFEKPPEMCHRSVVAKKIKEMCGNGLTINNI